jgi:hypothetical protein
VQRFQAFVETSPLRSERRLVPGGGIEPNVLFTLIFSSPRQNASCRTYAATPDKSQVLTLSSSF